MKKQIKAAAQVDQKFYEGLQNIFDDHVDNDLIMIADDDAQLNQLIEATDNLFIQVCEYLEIPMNK